MWWQSVVVLVCPIAPGLGPWRTSPTSCTRPPSLALLTTAFKKGAVSCWHPASCVLHPVNIFGPSRPGWCITSATQESLVFDYRKGRRNNPLLAPHFSLSPCFCFNYNALRGQERFPPNWFPYFIFGKVFCFLNQLYQLVFLPGDLQQIGANAFI